MRTKLEVSIFEHSHSIEKTWMSFSCFKDIDNLEQLNFKSICRPKHELKANLCLEWVKRGYALILFKFNYVLNFERDLPKQLRFSVKNDPN